MKMKSQHTLTRALGLSAIIIYGVGDILGAGIYAIVGKIAGLAGPFAWLSFAIAMCVILLTALSYSELASRFPKSGGVAIYIQESFGRQSLSLFAGLLLLFATLFSMSTLSQAFAGYLNTFGVRFPHWFSVAVFFIILLLINIRGIKQSSIANIVSTMVEITGLLMVLACGFLYLSTSGHQIIVPSANQIPTMGGVLQGAALAFFAFTGFEDLANVAEEVKHPKKNLPRAILFSLGIAGLFYLSVSWMATAIISGSELGQSSAPLFDVVKTSYPAMPSYIFSMIAMFAVFNTTLLNYITASRLLYGMSSSGLLPRFLQTVHQTYHTPYIAILMIFPFVLGLGLIGTLGELAGTTSAIVLTVFSFSSIALINIKLKERVKNTKSEIFHIPMFVPWLAVILNMTAIAFLPSRNIILVAIIISVGFIIALIKKN
jgi:APA family basic amino acid/polyamine antiporter